MALLDGGYAPLPHLVYPQSTWLPLHLAFFHICSTYVLVTWHIHPTLWHLCFDPPTSQAGWVFIYETSLIKTRYNPHDHLKIAQKLYKASLTNLGHSFVHNPIKQAQERPLKNNIPLSPPTPTWELKKLYCRKQVKPLVLPLLG